jgi:ArsR family transcriptional regulator
MSNHEIDADTLVAMFGALGNPHRLALFRQLSSCCAPGTRCGLDEAIGMYVGELGAGLGIAPSTLSHHLKTLRQAGLVRTERRGKRVECFVEPEVLRALASFFEQPLLEPQASREPTACCQPGVLHV